MTDCPPPISSPAASFLFVMVCCYETIAASGIAYWQQTLDRSSYRTRSDLLCLKICRSGLGGTV
ncbi:MAG: hypothetical protein ABI180_14440 [Microcoleus sp.]